MKTKFLFIIACLIIFTSCSLNDSDNESIPAQIVTQEWHLTESSGGFAGVDNQFDLETIIWIFDAENGNIAITNNNTDDTKEDAFPTGTYQYEISDVGGDSYIIIGGNEFGQITFTASDKITIDQNQTSTGSAADLYIYVLDRKLITTDVTID
ncbi:MAG: hypothetical protein ABJK28_02265 [Algibacter sp.]